MVSMQDQTGLPKVSDRDRPFVSWVTQTEEDKAESRKQKKMIFKDKHYARITPPGSKDIQFEAIPQWWDKIQAQADNGRIPPHWVDLWRSSFDHYMKGQELPPDGTPIRGWNIASGAMQEMIIRANILTVEQLSNATDEALANIGMGAGDYKRRAQAWCRDNEDRAGVAIEIAALEKDNQSLKKQVESLQKKFEEMKAAKKQGV